MISSTRWMMKWGRGVPKIERQGWRQVKNAKKLNMQLTIKINAIVAFACKQYKHWSRRQAGESLWDCRKKLWRYGSNERKVASCERQSTNLGRMKGNNEQIEQKVYIIKYKMSANSPETKGRGTEWAVLKLPWWIKRTHWVPGKMI